MTPGDDGCVPKSVLEALNPWWMFKATQCALKWAFVPKVSLSSRVGSIQTTLTTHAPFSWFAPLVSIPAAIPGGACPDWKVKVGSMVDQNVVCGSSYTDAIRAARPVLLGFMGLLALWPLIRSTAYAAFPIIKPQPGVLR